MNGPRGSGGLAARVGRRAVAGLGALLLLWLATFAIVELIPADPARVLAGPHASAATVARTAERLGLDAPPPERLVAALGRLLRLDLGQSTSRDRGVAELLIERTPATLELAIAGLAIGTVIGVTAGAVSAVAPGSRRDRAVLVVSMLLLALPTFVLGHLLREWLATTPRLAFGVDLFPVGGTGSVDPAHLALPALTLGLAVAAPYARVTRAALLDEMGRDYVRAAHAKGLMPRAVLVRHAGRNAAPPLLGQLGVDLGAFIGGVAIVEQIFGWPGVGRLALDAIHQDDVPLIVGAVLYGGLAVVLANLAIDLVVARIDPRAGG